MRHLNYVLLSICFALLSFLAWPPLIFSFLLFISWIPILFLQDTIQVDKPKNSNTFVWLYTYIGFLIWNILTTWWVWNASPGGAVMAMICNALLMSVPFLLFHRAKILLGRSAGYIALLSLWLAFEYIHLRWELTWPWLTLGNGFAKSIKCIQWYEYTGALGGSFWILITNIFIYESIRKLLAYHNYQKQIGAKLNFIRVSFLFFNPIIIIGLPIWFSLYLYNNYHEKDQPLEITVVQPNIDPYTEKFSGLSAQDQLNKILSLSVKGLTSTTDYLIWPETALPQGIKLSDLYSNNLINEIRSFLLDYRNLNLVTGISAYQYYTEKETSTARKLQNGTQYYDAYNSAIQMQYTGDIDIYHKSKLVPGVERMPYPSLFSFLDIFAIDMGGITGSLATQRERSVFNSGTTTAGTVICYESVFGNFVGEYVLKGANVLFIITNDAWWQNTPGHIQHMHYASLRAIEHRRSFARSANTGISCFINQKGEILQRTKYEEDAVINGIINKNNDLTFYSEQGDFIGRVACCFSVIIIILLFVRKKTRKFFA